jgi:hypothetical protein
MLSWVGVGGVVVLVVGLGLVMGIGTLMTRRLVVVSWMPNLRKASRICICTEFMMSGCELG